MDVTCERCETEYEFDETLVSERGTAVKCTQCGHMFKVYPPSGGTSSPWHVQTRDGRKETIGTLRELQQRIARGELTEEDRISRGNEGWKRLGDIAELESFFRAARERAASEAFARTMPAISPSAAPAPPPSPAEAAWEAMPTVPGDRPAKRTVLGVGAPAPAAPPPSPPATPRPDALQGIPTGGPPAPPPASRNAHGNLPTGAVPTPDGGWVSGPGLPPLEAGAPPPAGSTAPPTTPELPRLDDGGTTGGPSGPAALPRLQRPPVASPSAAPSERPPSEFPEVPGLSASRRSGAGKWLLLLGLLGLLGAGAWTSRSRWLPALRGESSEDPVARFLLTGDEALAEDHPDAYERALREYTRASAVAERDPRVFVRMAWAEALHAHALRLRTADARARGATDPAVMGEARALQREAERHAREALRLVDRARALASGRPSPLLENVAALAAFTAGDGSGGDEALARLRSTTPPFPGAVAWLEALRAMEPDGTVPPDALEPAQRAVREAPELIRARLLLARAALASRRIDEARATLEAVFRQHPDHPEARALLEAIEKGAPPAPPLVEVTDASTERADAGAPVPPEPTPSPNSEQPPSEGAITTSHPARTETAEPSAPRGDYDELVRKGERLQERGRSAEARAYFERALKLRPEAPEALVGLGYVALDQGRRGEALGHFRRAAARGYAEGFLGLGETYQAAGRLQEALESYESYLQRHPNGPSAPIARRKVSELRAQLGTREPEASPSGAPEPSETTGSDTPPAHASAAPGEPQSTAPEPTHPTAPNELPAPRNTDPSTIPQSDPPAVDSE